jgi:hypothetical protein
MVTKEKGQELKKKHIYIGNESSTLAGAIGQEYHFISTDA